MLDDCILFPSKCFPIFCFRAGLSKFTIHPKKFPVPTAFFCYRQTGNKCIFFSYQPDEN